MEDYGRFREAVANDPCAYCGNASECRDHIQPRAAGGDNGWENLTAACLRCNGAKSNRSLLGHLLAQPIDNDLRRIASRRASLVKARTALVEVGVRTVPADQRAGQTTPPRRNSRRTLG